MILRPNRQLVLLMFILFVIDVMGLDDLTTASPLDLTYHERTLRKYMDSGDVTSVAQYATKVIQDLPSTKQNGSSYSIIYKYLGVALHHLGKLREAHDVFVLALNEDQEDLQNYFLLGDTLLHQFKAKEAANIYHRAIFEKNLTRDVSKLFRARTWVADWDGFDDLHDRILSFVDSKIQSGLPPGVGPSEFADVSLKMLQLMSASEAYAKGADNPLPASKVDIRKLTSKHVYPRYRRHKVGFVSSDFGVHPVSTLVRGLLTSFNRSNFEVFVYCLTDQESWWRNNISKSADNFFPLHGMSTAEMAKLVRAHGVHTLVDLNGHTLHSGLPILGFKPSITHMSFLGSPMTTGANFVDYIITDPIATPPNTARYYTEKLLLLPPSYIVNDYAQILGHVVSESRYTGPGTRPAKLEDELAFLFASFSSFKKMDPSIWHVWTNILRRTAGSGMAFMRYNPHEEAEGNLKKETESRGIHRDRLVFWDQDPWIEHVSMKTFADLVLDTISKNGHTTTLDSMWGGVPVITMPGERMESRAGYSLSKSLGYEGGVVFSLKEYEDLAVKLAESPVLLKEVRELVEKKRVEKGGLFDLYHWMGHIEHALSATLDLKAADQARKFHVIIPDVGGGRGGGYRRSNNSSSITLRSALWEAYKDGDRKREKKVETSPKVPTILLHIGGMDRKEGWYIVDAVKRPEVDIVTPMHDLKMFKNDSVTAIYASHCLEHASYGHQRFLERTLNEWHRVLRNGGKAFISVPDLGRLSGLFINGTLSLSERFHVMRMMFGGQVDEHDFHLVGLDFDILKLFLLEAGFCEVERIDHFNLFRDSSSLVYAGVPISLNVVATPCNKAGPPVTIQLDRRSLVS